MAEKFIPSISIVIPVFNSKATLRLCLESIRGQNYPRDKIEIIIVDAGSTDNTLDIARQFHVNEIMDDSGTLMVGEWLRDFCHGMIERGYNNRIYINCNMRFNGSTQNDYKLM